jgi:integrase
VFDFLNRSDNGYDMPCIVRDKAKRNGKPRSPFWYCAFTDATGRRLKKSTGLTSKSKALQMCMQWQRAADMARHRALTEERAREVISEIVASVHGGEGLRNFTVRQWFDHFRKIKADSQSSKTALKYEHIAQQFLDFLGQKADLNILVITSEDVRKFRDRRKATGLSATTLNDDITILSAIFNGAWRDHVISNNPCTAVVPIKDSISAKRRKKKPFSPEQVSALIRKAEGDWKGLIRVAFYTGQRLSDCANLRWRQVDLLSKVKKITFEVTKTGDELEVPIHPALEDYLLSLPTPKNDEEFLFPSLAGRSVSPLSKAFRQIMEDAHIDNRDIRKRGDGAVRQVRALSFHSLRHAFVSQLANANVSEEQRMELTGHTTRDIHKIYTDLKLEQLSKAVALLPTL